MGLDALNQLVAQAQVDDLADMVDQALRNSRPMQRSLSVLQADPQAMALIRSRALAYDPEFHAPSEFFNNLESDADYVNDRTLATWMAAMHPSSQIDSQREWISSPRYKLQLIEQGMAIGDAARPLFALDRFGDLRRPAGGHGDEPVRGAGVLRADETAGGQLVPGQRR